MAKTKNEKLFEKAIEAINELFNDQSISKSQCEENLNNLKEEIDVMIDSLGD